MNSLFKAVSKRFAGSAALAFALLSSLDPSLAQPATGAVQPKAVPALDDFAQIPVPRGNFKGWCGRKDRFLVGFEGQLEAHEGSTKVVIPTMIPFATELQCDEDGQQLAYVSKRIGRAVKVDIASGASQILAEFAPFYTLAKRSEFDADVISISPNLRMIAADGKLNPAQDVRVIQIPSPNLVEDVRWSEDSSKLFYVLRGQGENGVVVVDTSQKKLGSGVLPKKSWFRDGWFAADGESLLLSLGGTNESGPGFLVRCRIADWKCARLKSNIDEISVGGRGRIGTISSYQVKPDPSDYDDGTIPIHPKYLAEVLDSESRLVARQVVLTGESRRRWPYRLLVSPRGTKVVLTWEVKKHAGCAPPNWAAPCIEAKMFDLSRGIR